MENDNKKWYEILKGKIINVTTPTVTEFHLKEKSSKFKIFGKIYEQIYFGELIKLFEQTIHEKDKKDAKLFCLVLGLKQRAFSTVFMIYPIFKISNGFHCGMYTSDKIPEMKNKSRNFKEFDNIKFDFEENLMNKLKSISDRIDENKFVKNYILKEK